MAKQTIPQQSLDELLERGTALLQEDKIQAAIDVFQNVLHQNNTSPRAWNNLAVAMLSGGYSREEVIPLFARACALQPDYADARFNLGSMLRDIGKYTEAADQFAKVIELHPTLLRAYNELSLCLREEGKDVEAEDVLRRALAQDENIPQLHNNLGNVLGDMGRFEEEGECYRKATTLDPQYALAWANWGSSYSLRGNNTQALEYYKKALSLAPDVPDLYQVYGTVLQEEEQYVEAQRAFEKAIALNPQSAKSYNSLYLLKRRLCDWSGLSDIEQKMNMLGNEDPFTSVLRSEDPRKNLEVARVWSKEVQRKAGKLFTYVMTKRARQKRKIRLGYLSNDLRDHPIGHMVAPLFGLHDRKQFEVYIYSNGVDDESVYRKTAERGADHFISIRTMTDDQAAARIHDDGIDMLIDLTGYTLGNRIGVCARRPAPIQINWLGFPGSSGAEFFDYIIGDNIVTPKGCESEYCEKVVRLPRCYQLNNNTIRIASKQFTKEERGLPKDAFVFASFNQAHKIDPTIWSVWMRMLTAVPKSVLWLWEQDAEASANLRREAKKRGIDPERLIFAPRMPKEEHLARLSHADLGLDTLIYGGHTTTSDFLYAGVPVITVHGTHFASRVCSSILHAVGLDACVAQSIQEYEVKGIEFANNLVKLKTLKKKLSHTKLLHTLFDTETFVRELEKVYVQIRSTQHG